MNTSRCCHAVSQPQFSLAMGKGCAQAKQPETITDANNVTADNSYDALNRIKTVTYSSDSSLSTVVFKQVVAFIYPVSVNAIFSFSGLRNTECGNSQLRVFPLQRPGHQRQQR